MKCVSNQKTIPAKLSMRGATGLKSSRHQSATQERKARYAVTVCAQYASTGVWSGGKTKGFSFSLFHPLARGSTASGWEIAIVASRCVTTPPRSPVHLMHPIIRGARDASGSVSTAIPAKFIAREGEPSRVRREAEKGHGGRAVAGSRSRSAGVDDEGGERGWRERGSTQMINNRFINHENQASRGVRSSIAARWVASSCYRSSSSRFWSLFAPGAALYCSLIKPRNESA